MKRTIKSHEAAEVLGVSVHYFKNVLCHRPGFPAAIQYTTRAHKHFYLDDTTAWQERQQQRACA